MGRCHIIRKPNDPTDPPITSGDHWINTDTGAHFLSTESDESLSWALQLAGEDVSAEQATQNAAIATNLAANTLNATKIASNQSQILAARLDRAVIVKQASDLVNIDSSKAYLIDGMVDMGTQQIEVPSGGFYYRGLDYFVSGLFSTADNYTMFVNKSGEHAGNVRGTNVGHYVTGANSQLLGLDNQGNFGACEFISCNLGSFVGQTTSLGSLTGYRQFRTDDAGIIRVADGLTLNGTMTGGLSIKETILLSIPSGATIFKEGTGLIFNGSVVSDINALDVDDNSTIFDFQESNFSIDWGFNLTGARFKLASNPVPNIDMESPKRYFKGCRGVDNTFIGGAWVVTTEVVTALPLATSAKLNGVTTYDHLVHVTGDNNNEFVYNSDVDHDFKATGSIVIAANPNDRLSLSVRRFNIATSDFDDVLTLERSVSNVVGGSDVAIFDFATPIYLFKGDRVEIWLENLTGPSNVTMQTGSNLLLEER